MSLEQILQLISMVKRQGGKAIVLGGGEPLLREDILAILDSIEAHGLDINLETNLTANSELVMKLSQYANIAVTTSLDSMNAEIHDRQRGKKGCFKKTMDNITLLREQYVPVKVNAMMLKSNIDNVDAYLGFAQQSGIVYRPLLRVLDAGRSAQRGALSQALDPSGISFVLHKMVDFVRSTEQLTLVSFYLPPALIPPDLIQSPCICSWGNFLGVTADGNLVLCPAALGVREFTDAHVDDLIGGRIAFDDLSFVRLARSFNVNTLEGVCCKCVAKRVCRGGCRVDAYLRFGRITSPDPICQAFYDVGLFPEHALNPAEVLTCKNQRGENRKCDS